MLRTIRSVAGRVLRYGRARLEFAVGIWFVEFTPVMLPWSRLRHDPGVMSQLRRIAMSVAWERVTARPDRMMLWLYGITWPVNSALRAAVLVMRQGRFVKQETGLSLFRQWRESVEIANTLNHTPRMYFTYRFFDRRMTPAECIQELDFGMLQYADIGASSVPVLSDKMQFFDACVRFDLPTPQVVAALLPGRPERWPSGSDGELPRRDLFLKWVDSEKGLGAERWPYDEGTGEWTRRGVRYGHDQMVAYCRERGKRRGLLVQHALGNHPEIRPLSGDTLSTLRIITFRDPGTPAKFVRAAFKVARPGADVDNVHAGGISCAIDPETGELGLARAPMPADGIHERHPVTGEQIHGVRLASASAAVALALRAHETLPVPWSVGWDVAMTPEGPVLVEGNPFWSPRSAQAPHDSSFPAEFTTKLLARLKAAGR